MKKISATVSNSQPKPIEIKIPTPRPVIKLILNFSFGKKLSDFSISWRGVSKNFKADMDFLINEAIKFEGGINAFIGRNPVSPELSCILYTLIQRNIIKEESLFLEKDRALLELKANILTPMTWGWDMSKEEKNQKVKELSEFFGKTLKNKIPHLFKDFSKFDAYILHEFSQTLTQEPIGQLCKKLCDLYTLSKKLKLDQLFRENQTCDCGIVNNDGICMKGWGISFVSLDCSCHRNGILWFVKFLLCSVEKIQDNLSVFLFEYWTPFFSSVVKKIFSNFESPSPRGIFNYIHNSSPSNILGMEIAKYFFSKTFKQHVSENQLKQRYASEILTLFRFHWSNRPADIDFLIQEIKNLLDTNFLDEVKHLKGSYDATLLEEIQGRLKYKVEDRQKMLSKN